MITGQSAVMMCGWGIKVGMAHSMCGLDARVGGGILCSRSISEPLTGELLTISYYTHVLFN